MGSELSKKKSSVKIQVVYTHENMGKKQREEWCNFFQDVKNLNRDEAVSQVDFCKYFEYERAVAWFEVVAYSDRKPVGYLRCLRNPGEEVEWYIGDLHVRAEYQRQGIATKLYQKVLERLKQYDACEYAVATVSRNNLKSIGLHEKMGFEDTGIQGDYLSPYNFYLDNDETIYKINILAAYPVRDIQWATEQLMPLWSQWEMKNNVSCADDGSGNERLEDFLKRNVSPTQTNVEIIWCGRCIAGFRCVKENIEYLALPAARR